MTVETRDTPNYDKLLKLVPDSVYIKDLTTTTRAVTRISSDNQAAIGSGFPSTNILKFTVNPTLQNLINLSETFIDLSGIITPYDDQNAQVKQKINNDTVFVPPYWWINFIGRITLTIGGTVVYDVNNPMNLVNFYVSHYKSFTDRQMNNLEEKGIYKIPEYDGCYLSSSYVVDNNNPPKWLNPPGDMYNLQFHQNANGDYITFQNIIYLTDLLPQIETLKPIYGESCILELTMMDKGYTGLRGIDVSEIKSLEITKFNQFSLNVVSYQLDSTMQSKLSQIYSKEIISIIDDIQYFTPSLLDTGSDSTLEIKIPMNIKFSSDLLYISCCQSNQPNYNDFNDFSDDYFYYNHSNLDNRFLPIKGVSIYADGVLLYNRNYATTTIDDLGNIKNNILLGSYDNANPGNVKICDYTILYKEYKEARYCTYENEHNAIPIMEWINNYFSINVPTSAFTRLSTESNVILSIQLDGNIAAAGTHGLNLLKDQGQKLNQLRIIQKSKKALVFKGWNQCEVKTITQSFSNEIEIAPSLNDTQKN